jgi:hypothetical protein
MRTDDLEFLIAQYADGSLSPHRVAEVEAILDRDAVARDLLAEYQSVDAALGSIAERQATPEVRWDRLQDRISRQVATLAAGPAAEELSPEVEEQLARYADGTLTPAEARLVEARLAADPHARLVAASYASLERAVEAVRDDRPAVRWDALAEHLSEVVHGSAAADRAGADRTSDRALAVAGAAVATSYKMDAYRPAAGPAAATGASRSTAPRADQFATLRGAKPAPAGVAGRLGRWMAEPRRLAVAACLLVAGGLSFQVVKGLVGPSPSPVTSSGGSDVSESNGSGVATAVDKPIIVVPTPGNVPAWTPGADTVVNVQVGPPPGGIKGTDLADDYGGTSTAADVRGGRSSIVAKERSAAQDHAAKDATDTAAAFPR